MRRPEYKKVIRVITLCALAAAFIFSATAGTHVNSYYRKDGTFVNGYDRNSGSSGGSYITPSYNYTTPSYTYPSYTQPSTPTYYYTKPAAPRFNSYKPVGTTTGNSYSHYTATSYPGARDKHGRILRSESAKREFERMTGYPHGRPGYVVDHIIPLKRGGPDEPSNMQWQTIAEGKAKDKWE